MSGIEHIQIKLDRVKDELKSNPEYAALSGMNVLPRNWVVQPYIESIRTGINPQINENQIVSLYNQYLNKYLDELGQKKIHFKQSKITQLLTELKELQLHEAIDINAPGGSYQPDAFSNNYFCV